MVQIRAPSGGGARAGATVRKGGSRVSFTPHPTTTRSRNGGMTSFLERPIPRAPLKVCRSHLSRLASALPSRTATGRRSAWASPADYVPVGSSGKRPASPRPRPDRGTGGIRRSCKYGASRKVDLFTAQPCPRFGSAGSIRCRSRGPFPRLPRLRRRLLLIPRSVSID